MKLLRVLIVLMMCTTASGVWAQDGSDLQSIDELISKSGMKLQVEQLPDVIKVAVDQSVSKNPKLTLDQRTKLKDIFLKSFNTSLILKSIRDYAAAGLTKQDLSSILAWVNSPLGQKITHLEEQASTGEAYTQMQEFAKGLQSNPPDPNRVTLIEKFDQAAYLTDNDVKMRMGMATSMAESIAPVLGQKNFSKETVEAQLEQHRPQIESAARQEVIIEGLFTYQTLTNNELQQYIDFYNSEAGKKYGSVFAEGLLVSIQQQFKEAGKELGEYLKTLPKPPMKSAS